ncbi:hypothetical protein C4D60_Mb05t27490 [Musa balbisiana]|uniref:Uncharacterized protein n=1 Tax=Musa balbisiana TaxID=52838 RepID=A0A4S8JZ89_MUSBA|nr:hypothetical protein C4D60_Mb05t27490 [Musa balbisiana]
MAGQREAVDVEDRVHLHKTVVPGSHRQQPAAPSVHEVIEEVPIPFHPKLPPVHLPPIPKLPPLPDLPKPHIPKLSFGLPFLNLHIIGTVLVSIGVLFLLAILAGVACCCCTNFRKKKMAGQREAVDVENRVHVHKTVVPGSHRQQPAAPSVHEVIEEGKGINEASRSEPYTSEKGMSEQRTIKERLLVDIGGLD